MTPSRKVARTRGTPASRGDSPGATRRTRAHHGADGARVDPPTRGVRCRGTKRSRSLPGASPSCSSSTAPTPSAASPRHAAPTKKSSSCRSWCGRPSATTTSTPARACATRPRGTGSNRRSATSAGTQDFNSVDDADVMLLIGANPTDAHPVFGSRMKQRLREGAELIVIDPRRIDLVRTPHIEASHHLQLLPGTNVAIINALAHVVVTEGLDDHEFIAARCEDDAFADWEAFIARPENSPEAMEAVDRRSGDRESALLLGCLPAWPTRPSTTGLASPSTARVRPWSWAWQISRWLRATSVAKASASIPCAARTTCRAPATWACSRTSSVATAMCPMTPSACCSRTCGVASCGPIQGCESPTCLTPLSPATFRGLFVQGEDVAQSDPNTGHVNAALTALDC